jgi:hypothetical protein
LSTAQQLLQYVDYDSSDMASAPPVPGPVQAAGGGLPAIMGGVGSKLAARFPLLYGAIQVWRSKGVRMTTESLWNLAKRFGPQMLVTAGILSVGALSELLMHHATRKRRRMNPLNPKALRRSTRRLISFQNKACKVQAVLGGMGGARRRRRAHCFKCRRNPCVCG